MSRDDALTINGLHRNSVHTTIDEVIGIAETYIHRPIVGLYSNYNYNYTSGSSVPLMSCRKILTKPVVGMKGIWFVPYPGMAVIAFRGDDEVDAEIV